MAPVAGWLTGMTTIHPSAELAPTTVVVGRSITKRVDATRRVANGLATPEGVLEVLNGHYSLISSELIPWHDATECLTDVCHLLRAAEKKVKSEKKK